MKKYFILSIGLIIAIAIYFGFIREYVSYQNVVAEKNHLAWEAYYNDFPHGWHMEEVRFIHADVARDITSARHFLFFFPESEHAKRVMAIRDSLWDEEIALYKSRAVYVGVDTGGVAFFKQLLLYMKGNDKKEIYLQLNKKLVLKDYESYDSITRRKCENEVYIKRPIPENILPLTSNFRTDDILKLESIVCDGLTKSFGRIFNPNFVRVVTYRDNDRYADSTDIFIKINYTIQNQEVQEDGKYIIPDLWIVTSEEKFKNYEIGIDINFNFLLSIPGTQLKYSFNEMASPSEDINNADIEGFYKKMTSNAFALYANSISENFGIQGVYFKDDKSNKTIKP